MKIKAHVIEVSDNGDTITAKLQGVSDGMAEWRNYLVVSIQVPTSPLAQRTYHLGRSVEIDVRPR